MDGDPLDSAAEAQAKREIRNGLKAMTGGYRMVCIAAAKLVDLGSKPVAYIAAMAQVTPSTAHRMVRHGRAFKLHPELHDMGMRRMQALEKVLKVVHAPQEGDPNPLQDVIFRAKQMAYDEMKTLDRLPRQTSSDKDPFAWVSPAARHLSAAVEEAYPPPPASQADEDARCLARALEGVRAALSSLGRYSGSTAAWRAALERVAHSLEDLTR